MNLVANIKVLVMKEKNNKLYSYPSLFFSKIIIKRFFSLLVKFRSFWIFENK